MAVPRRTVAGGGLPDGAGGLCGVGYAALRHRTASIWPVILFYLVLNVAVEISTPGTIPYLRPLLAFAIPFVFLGCALFLLRNQRVRADGI